MVGRKKRLSRKEMVLEIKREVGGSRVVKVREMRILKWRLFLIIIMLRMNNMIVEKYFLDLEIRKYFIIF